MSTPLSPLTPSRQNLSPLSPGSGDPVVEGGINEIMTAIDDTENTFAGSKLVDGANAEAQADLSYATAHEPQELDDEDDESIYPAPSSPFQYDVKDYRADFQMPQNRQPSLNVSERSTTPRKRSYEHVPEDQDLDEEMNDRYKKGTSRKDIPDINVYTDQDASFDNEHSVNRTTGNEVVKSMMDEKHNEGMSTVLHENNNDDASNEKENTNLNEADDGMMDDSHDSIDMDDTCLSTFSAVPNADMTSFANLRAESPLRAMRPLSSSPNKASDIDLQNLEPSTPTSARRSPRKANLAEVGSPTASPTPRRREPRDGGNPGETPNLLDLADQPSLFPRKRYSMQNDRYSPSRRSPLRTVRESIRSPAKVSLLDFDIPAAPTPRSIPTVTPRELESLKSSFLSEISSLKATLSGKEAEVSSLKQAVADAERRVGEALEEVRNEAASKETLVMEQIEWQRRGQEMENVLRSVKAEIVEGEQERDQLVKRVENAEKLKEQLESRMVELESQLNAALKSASTEKGTSECAPHTKTAEETANEVQDAVEKVARELHTLYKTKHETKVSALKKSYESRWEKRVREAENKLKVVNEENERLRIERDAAISEASRPDSSMIVHEKDEHEAEKRVLEAQIKGLQQEMAAVKDESERLRTELKMERAEKGELVAAVDEWLAIQNQPSAPQSNPQSPVLQEDEPLEPASPEISPEEFRQSMHRSGSSGIRPPSTSSGSGDKKVSKIGAPVGRHVRGNSGSKSGIAVFTPGRSAIMGSIERMGRGGVKDA